MKLTDTQIGKQYGGNHRHSDHKEESKLPKKLPTPEEYAKAYKEEYGNPQSDLAPNKIERFDRIPAAKFINRNGISGEFDIIDSQSLFEKKKIVLFSLPGAFTPTCSEKQLPAYDEAYDRFKGLGIDEVYCVSVNDGFVMNAWAEELGIKNIKLLSDGNGDFTQSLGMSVNKRHLGFGPRSWRYSIYVINNIVDGAFIEPGFNQTGDDEDPYLCSDPETIINYIQTTLR